MLVWVIEKLKIKWLDFKSSANDKIIIGCILQEKICSLLTTRDPYEARFIEVPQTDMEIC